MLSAALLTSLLALNTGDDLGQWTLEVRGGAYSPTITKDPAGKAAYRRLHEDGLNDALIKRAPLLLGIEIDYYVANPFGRLGVAFGLSTWHVGGTGLVCDGDEGCPPNQLPAEGEATKGNSNNSFNVYPLSVAGIYRFDLLHTDYGIPLMPYAKLGLDYFLWAYVSNGDTTSYRDGENSKTDKAEGGSWGYHATLGLAINLDWLEPNRPRTSSLRASHLFVEWNYLNGKSFGTGNKWDMSDTGLINMGLALDFE